MIWFKMSLSVYGNLSADKRCRAFALTTVAINAPTTVIQATLPRLSKRQFVFCGSIDLRPLTVSIPAGRTEREDRKIRAARSAPRSYCPPLSICTAIEPKMVRDNTPNSVSPTPANGSHKPVLPNFDPLLSLSFPHCSSVAASIPRMKPPICGVVLKN